MIERQTIILENSGYQVSEKSSGNRTEVIDRFTVDVPHARNNLRLRVLFSIADPYNAPDFILISPSIFLQIDYTQLVADWKLENPSALLESLEKIKKAVSGYFFNIFSFLHDHQQDVIYKSCKGLVSGDKNLEIFVYNDDFRIKSLHIAIPLPVKAPHESYRPVCLDVHHESGSDKVTVDITYPSWASGSSSLNIKPLGQNILHISKIEESLRQVFNYYTKELNMIFNSKVLRQEFFTELLKLNIGIPLEIDTQDYLKLSFHKEISNTQPKEILNVVVILEKEFPRISPSFKLRSMKMIKNNELREKKFMRLKMWDNDNRMKDLAQILNSAVHSEIPGFLTWIQS
jgi:hypothetical protein